MRTILAPSILNADFGNLERLLQQLEAGRADYLHLDIMDGRFVPNLTFGPLLVRSIRQHTSLTLDVHLMVSNPDALFDGFASAGADILTVHAEACPHLHRTVQAIKDLGLKAGVALNPATPLGVLDYVLDDLDQVLVMTVNPGWGGQGFIKRMQGKIGRLRQELARTGLQTDLQADGGINLENIAAVSRAGANSFVIGSALFKSGDPANNLLLYREKLSSVGDIT